MYFTHKIELILAFLDECFFFWHTIHFSQNDPFTEKRRPCQKKTTLFQKIHNQCNFMLKIHLRGTSRHSTFYFFDLGPDFLTKLIRFRIFPQISVKKRILSWFLAILGRFLSFDPHFQVFRFLQPYNMYTFSESPEYKLEFKL